MRVMMMRMMRMMLKMMVMMMMVVRIVMRVTWMSASRKRMRPRHMRAAARKSSAPYRFPWTQFRRFPGFSLGFVTAHMEGGSLAVFVALL